MWLPSFSPFVPGDPDLDTWGVREGEEGTVTGGQEAPVPLRRHSWLSWLWMQEGRMALLLQVKPCAKLGMAHDQNGAWLSAISVKGQKSV